jgi:hypothetical protein
MATTLKVIDCPDRRITRAAQELVIEASSEPGTGVTVLLPRRTYAPLLGRLLHDRTADRIASVISRLPQAAATIVPYDVQSRIRAAFPDMPEERITETFERLLSRLAGDDAELAARIQPTPKPNAVPIGALVPGQTATVEGRLREISVRTHRGKQIVSGEVADDTGTVVVEFHGPHDDIEPSQQVRLHGRIRLDPETYALLMLDPDYQVLQQTTDESD